MQLIAAKCWATVRLMWLTGVQISLHAQRQAEGEKTGPSGCSAPRDFVESGMGTAQSCNAGGGQ